MSRPHTALQVIRPLFVQRRIDVDQKQALVQYYSRKEHGPEEAKFDLERGAFDDILQSLGQPKMRASEPPILESADDEPGFTVRSSNYVHHEPTAPPLPFATQMGRGSVPPVSPTVKTEPRGEPVVPSAIIPDLRQAIVPTPPPSIQTDKRVAPYQWSAAGVVEVFMLIVTGAAILGTVHCCRTINRHDSVLYDNAYLTVHGRFNTMEVIREKYPQEELACMMCIGSHDFDRNYGGNACQFFRKTLNDTQIEDADSWICAFMNTTVENPVHEPTDEEVERKYIDMYIEKLHGYVHETRKGTREAIGKGFLNLLSSVIEYETFRFQMWIPPFTCSALFWYLCSTLFYRCLLWGGIIYCVIWGFNVANTRTFRWFLRWTWTTLIIQNILGCVVFLYIYWGQIMQRRGMYA